MKKNALLNIQSIVQAGLRVTKTLELFASIEVIDWQDLFELLASLDLAGVPKAFWPLTSFEEVRSPRAFRPLASLEIVG